MFFPEFDHGPMLGRANIDSPFPRFIVIALYSIKHVYDFSLLSIIFTLIIYNNDYVALVGVVVGVIAVSDGMAVVLVYNILETRNSPNIYFKHLLTLWLVTTRAFPVD